jgi:class 3 adenylate cyclase
MKTENLVILFTDIVGFTEASSQQSRAQNQRILDRHNSLLLPIVKRFRGRHIKSIGDALLLVFSSPTDGMRCAMAMQDALHEYNIAAPKDEEIHIRIAASLGEVRVTKGDIFGEPVNVTSRIEGITPADEVYFSEAVYLAMNKAEVPAIDRGVHELKGISKPVRIFSIPRFAETRLVADSNLPSPGEPTVGYPFGGMHLSGTAVANQWTVGAQTIKSHVASKAPYWLAGSVLVIILISVAFLWRESAQQVARTSNTDTIKIVAIEPTLASSAPSTPANPAPEAIPTAAVAPTISTDAAKAKSEVSKPKPAFINVAQAKAAYRAARITKERYRDIVRNLESEYDMYVRRAKIEYNEGRMSREVYRSRVMYLKRHYYGED